MARYVESATLDAGITGRDWVLENGSDVAVAARRLPPSAALRARRYEEVSRKTSEHPRRGGQRYEADYFA